MFAIDGCSVIRPTTLPTQVEPLPIPTILPFHTPRPPATDIPSPIRTPINTLNPKEAEEAIRRLLQEPVDCAAPCFWGITPGDTTLDEADDIFDHLGLSRSSTTFKGKVFSGIHFVFDSGLSVRATLTIQDKIVENIQLKFIPEKQEVGTRREWAAYSPETLIERYGPPTRVDFLADWGPGPFYSMQMYYDAFDLIVQYAGDGIISAEREVSVICPLAAQFDSVWLWLGKNPVYPPGLGVPLDEVTSLTVDEFSQLMIGEPDEACFIFDGNAYKSER